MTKQFANLAARHLRRQRALLMLWRYTLQAPIFGSPEWSRWLPARERLVGELASPETELAPGVTGGGLAAAEGATGAMLQQMQEGELRMGDAIAHLEALLLAVGKRRLRVAARVLRAAAEGRAACRSYDAVGRADLKPSRRR